MAGEGERGLKVKRGGLEGPGGEGRDEARGLEGVVIVVVGLEGGEREIRCDETHGVVLGAHLEHVVGMRLSLFHYSPARAALRD